jgi:ABC-type multidrug transport system fused ATPase/permease subunit
VLILDEATANIDTRSEARIQEALRACSTAARAIVVAHRLSTVRDADLILVVHEGRVVEQGSHEQLVRQAGFYARMLERIAG